MSVVRKDVSLATIGVCVFGADFGWRLFCMQKSPRANTFAQKT